MGPTPAPRHDPDVATKTKHGGARAQAGRRSIYADPLTEEVCVRLSADQYKPIARACRKLRVPVGAFLRETALVVAGVPASKRAGLEKCRSARPVSLDVQEDGIKVVVKMTRAHAVACRAYCSSRDVVISSWLREAALREVGAAELGATGAAEALASAAS